MNIDKNIPVEDDNLKESKYPFKGMSVGDSFFIECDAEKKNQTKSMIVSSVYQFYRRNKGFKFKVSRVEGGVRCWRIEVKNG